MCKKKVFLNAFYILSFMCECIVFSQSLFVSNGREKVIDALLTFEKRGEITDSFECFNSKSDFIKKINFSKDTNLYANFINLKSDKLKFNIIKSMKITQGDTIVTCLRLKYIDSCTDYLFLDYEYRTFDSNNNTIDFFTYVFTDSMRIFHESNNSIYSSFYKNQPYLFPEKIENIENDNFLSLFRGIKDGFLVYEEFHKSAIESVIGLYNLYTGIKVFGKNLIEIIPIIWQQ